MPGLTLQGKLEHLKIALAEAEREQAAGIPYPDAEHESWDDKIAWLNRKIADVREMIANE